MKRFVFILFVLSLFSCKETKKENISHLVKEWNNKKIVYPDIMHFTVLGADTNFLFNLKSATPFPKCYLQEKWTFDS